MTRFLARTAFFFSGVAGLTFEILWTRYLALAMGGTTLAVAATTAAYMGGLALGSHLGGRWGDRLRRPLSAYGGLEIGIALCALAVPAVIGFVPHVDAALFSGVTSAPARAGVRFVVSALLLGLPTTAMGMTLPVLARAVTTHVTDIGREVGQLYALNILGAMVGAGCAGFWWIPSFGLAATGGVAVGLDLLLGLAALLAGLRLPALLRLAPLVPEAGADAPVLKQGARDVVLLLAITGAAAMVLQVLWTRALSTALGPSTYAFSAIVCTYLAGLALGGFVAAQLADALHEKRWMLALAFVITGFAALVGISLVDDLPLMLRPFVLDEKLTITGLWEAEFLLAALSLLPATTAMGALFPLALAAVAGSDRHLSQAVGRAYAVNTLGNIAGSTLAVFVVLPLAGVEGGLRVGALGYAVAAILLAWRVESTVPASRKWAVAVAAAVCAGLIVVWPSWNVGRWTSGLYRLSMTRAYFDDTVETAPVVFHKDGLASTVTVEEDEGVRWIKVDGKIDGSSEGDMPTQTLSGLLPMLLHPSPKNVAVIGCGSCVTVSMALRGNAEKVTLVEIEGAVVEAAHLFDKVNHSPWNDPRFRMVEDDGRNFLRRSDERFEVIISEPSNPWMTGAASLFTDEFFQLAASRLTEDGMFLQWLQIYELSPARIASLLRTFQRAFPEMLVFSAHPDSNDLLLVGQRQPFRLAWDTLAARVQAQSEALKQAGVDDSAQLLARLLLTTPEVQKATADAPLNTDDNALIEFGAPKDLLVFAEKDPSLPFLEEHAGARQALVRKLFPTPLDLASELSLAAAYAREGMLADAVEVARAATGRSEITPPEKYVAQETLAVAGLLAGEDVEAAIDVNVAAADRDYAEAALLATKNDEVGALRRLEEKPDLTRRSAAHALFHGYLLYRDGQYGAARRALQYARKDPVFGKTPVITYYLARNFYESGEYAQAYGEMRTYVTDKHLVTDAVK